MAANVMADPAHQISTLFAGLSVDLVVTPEGVPNDQVTQVQLRGTDPRGVLATFDAPSRQNAAAAALLLAGQLYPKATIQLSIVDGNGTTLLSGRKVPGGPPSVDQ
jgi:hypothetical protein